MNEFCYTHNNDPTYYETNRFKTNCGSYALRLKEWYDNEIDEECGGIDEWIGDLVAAEIPDSAIPDIIARSFIDELLGDFPNDELILLDKVTLNLLKDTSSELIAFRVYAPIDQFYDGDYCCFDFHFRVWRGGKWMEKNGCKKVQECTITDWGVYNSSTFFLLHKIF